jgi:hypothetical protein
MLISLFECTAARRSAPSGSPESSCNTGPVQCCNSVTRADHSAVSTIIGLLGLVIGPEVLVGLQCSPLSVVGLGGNSWWAEACPNPLVTLFICSFRSTQQPVCCENNTYNGLIVIGCSPSTLISFSVMLYIDILPSQPLSVGRCCCTLNFVPTLLVHLPLLPKIYSEVHSFTSLAFLYLVSIYIMDCLNSWPWTDRMTIYTFKDTPSW